MTSSLLDPDGVVVVPHEKAAEVLALAQKLDNTEHSMYPIIEKLHSIMEAVKQFEESETHHPPISILPIGPWGLWITFL